MPKLFGVSTYGWRLEIDDGTNGRMDNECDEDLQPLLAMSSFVNPSLGNFLG